MKHFIPALILIFLNFSAAYGQSTLVFTRVMDLADFPTTGFAVGNPGTSAAQVSLTLYSFGGQVIQTSLFAVPATGQVAHLASEIFPNATSGGWVQGTSSTTGLVGFWLGGDFAQFEDGTAAAVTSQEFVLSLITSNSELNIVNPGAGFLPITIRLYGTDGREIAQPAVRLVPSRGALREGLSTLFNPNVLGLATHARLLAMNSFAATIIARDFLAAPSWSALNAAAASSSQTTLYFPHIVSGAFSGANYVNVLGLANLSGSPQNVSIIFTPADGSDPIIAERIMAANGSLREASQTLFGFGAEYRDGWLTVRGSLPLTGFVAYADATTAGVTIVAPQTTPQTETFFAHFAELPPWMTGIAILNANPTEATVEVAAFSQGGVQIGTTARFVLPAMSKIARLLREWAPQTLTRSGDGGVVRVRTNLPVFGLELFFTTDLKILSGIGSLR